MKRCFKCLCEKPLDDFYKHNSMGEGRLNKCKDCTKKDVTEHRQANLERVRAYDRMRGSMPHRVAARKDYAQTEAGRAAHRRALRASGIKFPNKRKARIALGNAIRDGRVLPQPCWVCGDKAQAHHPDYDQPLAVVWLCPPHHRQAHALVANDPDMERTA